MASGFNTEAERIAAHRAANATAARVDRLARVWDDNLPTRDKKALAALAMFEDAEVAGVASRRWNALTFDQRVQILNAFRRAVEFGMECARAIAT